MLHILHWTFACITLHYTKHINLKGLWTQTHTWEHVQSRYEEVITLNISTVWREMCMQLTSLCVCLLQTLIYPGCHISHEAAFTPMQIHVTSNYNFKIPYASTSLRITSNSVQIMHFSSQSCIYLTASWPYNQCNCHWRSAKEGGGV